MSQHTTVVAAGAVCWRRVDGIVCVLLVHRGDRADVSLPKGKVDPGETVPETAVREIAEETGLSVTLGAPLGELRYPLPSGQQKIVYYWVAEVTDEALEASLFQSNSEIAALEWVPLDRAREALSYPHDADIVDVFAERVANGAERTFPIVLLRHAKAVSPDTWDGPDTSRPLLQRGSDQAASIALGVAAFSPRKLISSSATRCLATVAPIARVTGLPVKESDAVSKDAHERGKGKVGKVIAKRVRRRVSAVICSHGPVLPELAREIAEQSHSPLTDAVRRAALLSPGEFCVFHLSATEPEAGIVGIEIHSPSI